VSDRDVQQGDCVRLAIRIFQILVGVGTVDSMGW
jgi:hypothetical protein